MKCLTICQPYAHLIVTPQSELPRFAVQKRVENRTWECRYRGPLLIHAGKSKKFLSDNDHSYGEMVFGAIVGSCNVIDCIGCDSYDSGAGRFNPFTVKQYPWLINHPHAEGPWCIVLDEVRKFVNPIPYKGALGLFDVPGDLVAEECATAFC